jgi:DNA-binding cell septation regulator SpoVG
MDVTEGLSISRMSKGNWGKCRAFFDLNIETAMGVIITIKGLRLMESMEGLWLSEPSTASDTPDKDGNTIYRKHIYLDNDSKSVVLKLGIDEYNSTEKGKEKMEEPQPVGDNELPF